MILIADLKNPEPITPRSNRLQLIFGAPFESRDMTFEMEPGDDFKVYVLLLPGLDEAEPRVVGLNMVSWRSIRQVRSSSRRGQSNRHQRIFGTMFRDDSDTPDAQVMAMGDVQVKPVKNVELPGETTIPAGELDLRGCESHFFQVVVPSRLVLNRPGLFGFLISLSVQVGDSVRNFILDPEVDVGGTYPPDDGGGVLPAGGG